MPSTDLRVEPTDKRPRRMAEDGSELEKLRHLSMRRMLGPRVLNPDERRTGAMA